MPNLHQEARASERLLWRMSLTGLTRSKGCGQGVKGFRDECLGSRVWGLGVKVEGLGFWVGLRFQVQRFWFKA